MADRPIIFSAPMVRALLDGRKTQTRRVFKLPTKGEYVRPDMGGWTPCTNGGGGCFTFARDGSRVPRPETVGIWNQTTGTCFDAPHQVGDRLWVRETWQAAMSENGPCILYRADGSRWSPEWTGPDEGMGSSYDYDRYPADYSAWASDVERSGPWASSLHIPRWASRLTLTVTDVRVQRLQEISEVDAIAEGALTVPLAAHGAPEANGRPPLGTSPRQRYEALWNSLHGPNAWSANPWVVALTFTVEQANIDALREAA